jgi:diguanylate cyclase (GGDEF)-like protein
VLYCDLDGFKEVNDTAGHAAGDAVLIEVAARLRGALREGDTVARVGGDEFVIVIEPWNRPGADSARDVATARALSVEVADRVVRAMTRPFFVDEKAFAVTVSVGVTYAALTSTSSGADRAGDVIREADEAMYLAKNDGKNRIRVFGDDTNALVTAKR